VEAWIPAFAGTAREAHIKIVTMLVDTNWITASKAEVQEPRARRRPPPVNARRGLWMSAFAGLKQKGCGTGVRCFRTHDVSDMHIG